jgi:hypothetical protein
MEKYSPDVISKINKEYEELTDENQHGEAALLLVKTFGTELEEKLIKAIMDVHHARGNIMPEEQQLRDSIGNKYYKKLKNEMNDMQEDTNSPVEQSQEEAEQINSELDKVLRLAGLSETSRSKALSQMKEQSIGQQINWPGAVDNTKKKKKKDDVSIIDKVKELFNSEEQTAKPLTEAEFDEAAGEKDACYRKVKSRYKVWPSAYASGALTKCRKVGADNWGNSKK